MAENNSKKIQILPSSDGPLVVKDFSWNVETKKLQPEQGSVVALCRCGRSSNKPLCDGTHAKQRPDAPYEQPWKSDNDGTHESNAPDRLDTYERDDKTLTIYDNRSICAHAGHCTDKLLNRVFFHGKEPWCDPNGADIEEIKRVIRMCPSGALTYAEGDKEAPQTTKFFDRPEIEIEPNMFYKVKGGFEVQGANKLQGQGEDHAALCRCGQSQNKPYCNGNHYYCQFRDDNWHRIVAFYELDETGSKTIEWLGISFEIKADPKAKTAKVRAKGQDLKVIIDPKFDQVCIDPAEVKAKFGVAEKDGPHAMDAEAPVPDIEDLGGSGGNGSKKGSTSAAPNGPSGTASSEVEPYMKFIKDLARDGLKTHHGPMTSMGVPIGTLPKWEDIQILTAQLARKPLMDDEPVSTKLVIGARCKRPLVLDLPVFVSDMSFGALSRPAKLALSKGAEIAGTGICSGEGGSLDAERELNTHYFYEIASAMFGYSEDILKDPNVSAVHFKGGQAAKTGTGGHLSGNKVTPEIAKVRKLKIGEDAISPATFKNLKSVEDFKTFAERVRLVTGGVPIGFKISAQHIEEDIQFAIDASADYIILDGRGGATGAAPIIFRDNISVPTIPAVARARRYIDKVGAKHITLIATGGLRTPSDFIKAMCLGADGVAISNSAMQAIGCVAARACNTNKCPSGVATQDPALAALINVDKSAQQLANFLNASKGLIEVMARACGHTSSAEFNQNDITTWDPNMARLTGIQYGGVIGF